MSCLHHIHASGGGHTASPMCAFGADTFDAGDGQAKAAPNAWEKGNSRGYGRISLLLYPSDERQGGTKKVVSRRAIRLGLGCGPAVRQQTF